MSAYEFLILMIKSLYPTILLISKSYYILITQTIVQSEVK